jgi:transposase
VRKLERQVYGQRSERSARLIDQLALDFAELEASATEDELAAEQAVAQTTTVRAFTRRRAERDTFPDHLPRERVVIDPPTACACCGSNRLRKLGEDVTQTLETTPRRWKVIETVREKFSCRDCETISQTPAPFHVIPRGWAGPSLLAMIVFEKFGQHQPLNRQAERYALEGAPIALSTMADQVGLRRGAASAARIDRSPCSSGRSAARRRHDGADPCKRPDGKMDTLVQTAKLNKVDPQAWLADVLARIADTPQTQISELLPSNWRPNPLHRAAA